MSLAAVEASALIYAMRNPSPSCPMLVCPPAPAILDTSPLAVCCVCHPSFIPAQPRTTARRSLPSTNDAGNALGPRILRLTNGVASLAYAGPRHHHIDARRRRSARMKALERRARRPSPSPHAGLVRLGRIRVPSSPLGQAVLANAPWCIDFGRKRRR